jgi:hypothetical protein
MYQYYIPATVGYGVLRKTFEVRNATIKHYDSKEGKTIKVPMLVTDKAALIVLSGLISMYAWPIHVGNDIRQLEMRFRGLDPAWYSLKDEKETIADYIFT